MKESIAFVGVGRMGANMALRLRDQGYNVTAVHDVNRASAEWLGEEVGATVCDRLAEVTASADVIFTVVSDDVAMREIFAAQNNENLLTDAHGKLFINCATISPQVHIEVEQAADEAGAHVLEACMASSITQAR